MKRVIELTAKHRAMIRSARIRAGLSQAALGAKVGATSQFITQIENGRRATTLAKLRTLCAAVGLRIRTTVVIERI